MIIPEIATTVNSDPDTTLNDLLYIMDYKQYGESSGVYQNKDALQKALMTWYAINDTALRKEAVQTANSLGRVGELLSKQYGANLPQLAQYKTFDAIKATADPVIIDAFYKENGVFRWLFSSNVLNADFYNAETLLSLFESNRDDLDQSVYDSFYNTYKEHYNESIDLADTVYRTGGKWWAAFNNQTWLSSLYNKCVTDSNVKTSTASVSGTGDSSAGTRTVNGNVVYNAKVVLRAFIQGKVGAVASAGVTCDGVTTNLGLSSPTSGVTGQVYSGGVYCYLPAASFYATIRVNWSGDSTTMGAVYGV